MIPLMAGFRITTGDAAKTVQVRFLKQPLDRLTEGTPALVFQPEDRNPCVTPGRIDSDIGKVEIKGHQDAFFTTGRLKD